MWSPGPAGETLAEAHPSREGPWVPKSGAQSWSLPHSFCTLPLHAKGHPVSRCDVCWPSAHSQQWCNRPLELEGKGAREDVILPQPAKGLPLGLGLDASKSGHSFMTAPYICFVNIFNNGRLLKVWTLFLANRNGALAEWDLHWAGQALAHTHTV